MKKYLSHSWKIYLALLLIYIFKIFTEISRHAGPFTLHSLNHYHFAYFIFIIGLTGLAFGKPLFTRETWKFIFACAVIYFLNFWVIHPGVMMLMFPAETRVLNSRAMMAPFIPLLYALYFYAWKANAIWDGQPRAESEIITN